jgi:hypothetical protein
MRRLLTWLACAAGTAWILRRLRRRPPEPAADPAEDLRRKLDEARAVEPEPVPEPEPEPEPASGLAERRRVVHVRARASIDEMRSRKAPPR